MTARFRGAMKDAGRAPPNAPAASGSQQAKLADIVAGVRDGTWPELLLAQQAASGGGAIPPPLLAFVVRQMLELPSDADAASALQREPAEICALLYRSTLDGVGGWRASVSTRDGRVHARCWARRPENAAQLLISTLSGEG